MSTVSVLIQLWRGSLVRPSRALDIASCRRIKPQVLFPLRIYLNRIRAASDLILRLDSAVAWQSSTNITSSGYCPVSSHQATRALPSLDLLSEDECSLCLDSAVTRQPSTNFASLGYCLESSHQATRRFGLSFRG
jgi:hypothetical protein